MKTLWPITVLISAERFELDAYTNSARSLKLKTVLERAEFSFKTGVGHFKDKREVTFIVLVNTARREEDLGILKGLAADFQQDSILIIHSDRSAVLEYTDGRLALSLPGQFKEVQTAEGLDAFTVDSTTGRIYSVV